MGAMRNFIDFIRNRGISGFAVGFILGKATSDLIGSLVNDIINPVIGIATGNFTDLSKMSYTIGSAAIKYGNFIVLLINFVILALTVYIIFKVLRLERFDQPATAPKK
jgi:large conductance mechanosensitive channel